MAARMKAKSARRACVGSDPGNSTPMPAVNVRARGTTASTTQRKCLERGFLVGLGCALKRVQMLVELDLTELFAVFVAVTFSIFS